jgi:hypothetical protein
MNGRRFHVSAALLLAAALTMFGTDAYGQGTATSSLSGVVVDTGGGVVPGANIVAKNDATNTTVEGVSGNTGAFSLPAMDPGTYTVTVSLLGFKTAIIKNVKLITAIPADVKVTMEVGGIEETVTVSGATELVQTRSATIASTINVDQINNLPLATRNAMNFVTLLPGVNTTGINRNSNFLGLPSSATAISLDGVNNNENYNKSTEGLFAMVTPRQDAVEAVTVTTATPGSESGGHGAVSINFVTRSGSDQFVGSAYWYHRDPGLNSNYYFNLQKGLPKNNVRINQYGARQGGPIVIPGLYDGHGKSFFFFNYEEFRMPNNFSRTRTILTPDAQKGLFTYGGNTVDLFALAANPKYNQIATIDPTIQSVLNMIRSAAVAPGVIRATSDPNELYYDFLSGGNQIEKQPTLRLDDNLTAKHRLTGTYTHQYIDRNPDHLNSADVRFPGAPNYRRYVSDRNITSGALRSVFSGSVVNELRGGLKWGPSYFGKYMWEGPDTLADENGRALNISGTTASSTWPGSIRPTNWYYETATSGRSAWSWNVDETLNWQKGAHSWRFGASYYDGHMWNLGQTAAPTISFGVDSNDPASGMFTAANFPNASTAQLGYARNLYAILTGRVTQIEGQARADENTGQYALFGPNNGRLRQQELGFFAQDLWRVHPQLTINAGLRWDVQLPVTSNNSIMAYSTMADLCGVSGVGSQYGCNMYAPGASAGSSIVPGYYLTGKGEKGYKTDWNNVGPSIGFAWRPGVQKGIGRLLLGDPEQATFRAGYSVSYTREGMALLYGVYNQAQGSTLSVLRNATNGNLGTLPVLLRNDSQMGLPPIPAAPTYPIAAIPSNNISIFDPNIQVAMGRSVTISFQRALTKDTAFEARYNKTLGRSIWNQYNLNYGTGNVNIVENHFLDEFKLAQANLQYNIANGKGSTFAYTGPGTSPLPTYLAYLNGTTASSDPTKYSGSSWTNSTFVGRLATQNPNPYSAATDLQGDATRRANAIKAGLAPNFFIVNPAVNNAYIYKSDGSTTYDALQLELRRRLSAGLQFGVNYQYATSDYTDSIGRRYDLVSYVNTGVPRHALKMTWDYSLPFGRGRHFGSDMNRVVDAILGGWEFHGDGRIQRAYVDFGNVRLVGMTLADLQAAYKVRFGNDPTTGVAMVYMLPQDIIDNTIKAFNVSATSATGYGSAGAPSGRYIAPANSASCVQVKTGECAPLQTLVLAPIWSRIDASFAKKFPFGGRKTFEVRLDVMNLFNTVNFNAPGTLAGTSATTGQVTSGYTDMSNTFDPGGRLGQVVLRFSW